MSTENDLVLVYFEDHPLTFARIEQILPDAKPNWYHVKLLMLQVPLQVVTWILRDAYIDGEEFTMNGKRMRLEQVVSPEEGLPAAEPETETLPDTDPGQAGNVISLAELKKR